jgi:hypothetical protein
MENAGEPPTRISAWRTPGLFGTPFEDRVFVGGSYGPGFLPALAVIRDVVREHGFDGIMAAEFKRTHRTAESNYQDALVLLRGCGAAIFDVSDRAGQLHEVQEAIHVGIKRVLVVHGSAAHLSDMTVGACRALGVEPVPYDGIAYLRAIVSEWIESESGLSPTGQG